jgi:hypothetical protein
MWRNEGATSHYYGVGSGKRGDNSARPLPTGVL